MDMNFLLGVLLVSLVALIVFTVRRDRKNRISEEQAPLEQDRALLVSGEDCVIVASAGATAQPENLPESTNDCVSFNESHNQRTYACGHSGPETFQLDMWGIKSKKFYQTERCPACWIEKIKKYAIRCTLCGLPIFPGDGVALYHERSPSLRRDIGTKIGDSFIGCIRWDCCPSGGFFAGHWTEDGFRSAFDGGLTAAVTTFKTGKTTISNT